MINPSIYLRAAKLIATGEQRYSCTAITIASKRIKQIKIPRSPGLVEIVDQSRIYRDLYVKVMGNRGEFSSFDGRWFNFLHISDIEYAVGYKSTLQRKEKAMRDFRVLMLVMMAHCCKDMENL
jgi:hypothetical protein